MPRKYEHDMIIDFYGWYEEAGNMYFNVSVCDKYYGYYSDHTLKGYFRNERTLDDHMGNTPCGWYVNLPINGKTRRVYVFS